MGPWSVAHTYIPAKVKQISPKTTGLTSAPVQRYMILLSHAAVIQCKK